jgi:O-antigen/teichoic acid export membrane protein
MSESRIVPHVAAGNDLLQSTEASRPADAARGAAPAAGRGRLLLRDSGIYLIGNLMQKAAAFVLIPLYTHALSTAQYGLLDLANTVVNLLLIVAALGVPAAINKCYHRDCRDDADRARLAGTAFLFTIGATGALALVGWALEGRLAGVLFHGPEGLLVYRYTLVWLVLAQLASISFEWVRAAGKSSLYVGFSLIQLAVQFVCIVLFVKWGGMGLAGVLAGNVAGLVAVNLIGGFVVTRRSTWTIDRRLLAALASFGMTMIPVFVSGWVVNVSDRFFVQSMVGLGALGVYALGYKFGALVDLLIVMPFQRAWTPIFFQMAGDARAPQFLARVTTYLTGCMGLASLAVILAVPPLLRLIASPDFLGASRIVPLICLAYALGGIANCLGNGLIVAGRVRLIAGYALVAGLANLALNFLLIPWVGLYGAAIATVLAFAVQLAGIMGSLSRCYPVRLEWRRMAGLVASCLLPYLASCALPPLPLIPDLAVRLALFAACPLLIVALRLVSAQEMADGRRLLADWGLLRGAARSTGGVGPPGPA